jgi:hypothetical protein
MNCLIIFNRSSKGHARQLFAQDHLSLGCLKYTNLLGMSRDPRKFREDICYSFGNPEVPSS